MTVRHEISDTVEKPVATPNWLSYAKYRSSRIEWLREVPEHWQTRRLRYAMDFLNHRRIPISGEDRSVMQKKYPYYGASGIIDAVDDYIFDEPLILVAEDGANLLSRSTPLAFVARGKYWVNNHAHILRPRQGPIEYWEGLLQTIEYLPWVTGSAQPKLTKERLGSIELPIPPVDEQRAIADFLDRETAKIDALVAKKRRLIELLEEKRTALISHAVTKGLDPNVPMKDSGVGWLGAVPTHWDVLSFRRYIVAIEQGWSPVAEQRLASPDEWAVLKVGAVHKGRFREEEHKALGENTEPKRRFEICEGDFLITRGNTPELVADTCIVSECRSRLMLSDLHYRVRTDGERLLSTFACFWLLSRAGRAQIEADARGTSGSMVKVSQGHIRNWTVCCPPLSEQTDIVAFIETRCRKLGSAISKVEEAVERLNEYRTALISAAVTGKIDVRNA